MKIRTMAKNLANLFETEALRQVRDTPLKNSPTTDTLRDLIITWRIGAGRQDVRYEVDMMGAGNSIYLQVGPMYFALIQNWDACPDGMNRFLMVVPLFGVWDDRRYYYGVDEIPIEIASDSLEVFVDILADLHNATL